MPVRVKQRYLASEDRTELERLWESLKQCVVALLVASGRVVALRMRDLATSRSLTISGPKDRKSLGIGPGPPEKLRLVLSTLQQAGLISVGNAKSWIPASASSRSIVIKGGICLKPAPNKSIQFLSLGISPLSREGHNELYDHINRLFSRSRFGAIEEEILTEEERLRRQRDKRFKQDGLTNKQLSTEKGVDRWPMFVLSISFKDDKQHSRSQGLDEEAKLASVINVLDALVTGWLTSNHFCRQKFSTKERDSSFELEHSFMTSQKLLNENDTRSSNGERILALRESRPTSKQRPSSPLRPYTGVASMNALSRIKSSNRAVLEKARPYAPGSKRPSTAPAVEFSTNSDVDRRQIKRFKSDHNRLAYISELSQSDLQLSVGAKIATSARDNENADESRFETPQDDVMDWTDPYTKQTHRINSRTGAVLAPEPRKSQADVVGTKMTDRESQSIFARSLRLPPQTQLVDKLNEGGGWLESVLKKWQNPVFPCAEKSIQQASLHIPGDETSTVLTDKFNFTTACQINQAFTEISHLNANRITKTALKNARVVSQVDSKFILVAVNTGRGEHGDSNKECSMLVMIDQHAADERVKVEQLLQDLSEPLSATDAMQTSTLGHKSRIRTALLSKPLTFRISAREIELFRSHARRFADWGILFDLPQSPKDAKGRNDSDLIVRYLPPVIAERCKLDPKLLINLLRTELWKLVETPTSIAKRGELSTDEGAEHDWLKTVGILPQGLLDMVNSRACRSAIMFNDVLSNEDCKELLAKLVECKFPFLCAHGRPSMVPLIDLGRLGELGRDEGFRITNGVEGFGRVEKEQGFVEAFGRWKGSMRK
jgi:DNA mismatch repair protein MLH3